MLKAVLALTKTPQNNLRIFKVGAKKKRDENTERLGVVACYSSKRFIFGLGFWGGTGWKPGFRRRVPNQPHGHLERMVP